MKDYRLAVTRRCCSGYASSAGFTLIELLVSLTILALLASVVGPGVIKWVGGSKSKTARVQIESIASALDNYHLEIGRYPSQEQGLYALVEAPSGVVGWDGPYLAKKKLPDDPWGAPYIYRYPGENGTYDLLSYGADGQPGGENDDADILGWE